MADGSGSAPTTIDDYIAGFPDDVQDRLRAMRQTIRAAAPEATETINYGVPTFQLNGNLVHFGASRNHIGFYPTPSGMAAFQDRFAGYKSAKGSVQFPNDQPLPLSLVTEIVRFRVEEQRNKKKKR